MINWKSEYYWTAGVALASSVAAMIVKDWALLGILQGYVVVRTLMLGIRQLRGGNS